jgi:asparagine synthase (glutamine-hydrolysing)
LSGLGSDELFGGYSTFASTARAESVAALGRWVPGPVRRLTAGMAVKAVKGDAMRKAAATWKSPNDFPHAYFFTRTLFTPSRVKRLLSPYFGSDNYSDAVDSPWRKRMQETTRQASSLDSFTSVSCFELQSYMLNTLLRDTDIASMASSLEVRVPFLDHRLVEFVARLPKAVKYNPDVPKSLLIAALSDVLPDNVVHQSKRTFTLPWEVWLRGPLGVRLSQDLADLAPPLQPFMNQRAVHGMWQSFVVGQTTWSRPWSLYVLNLWVRRHMTGATTDQSFNQSFDQSSNRASTATAVRPAVAASAASNPQA